ncbi:hypothetical protein Tco_1044397 [Tanacetum coccineum]|uniref:UBN2 domain-containing protein n=1 Tax=Tanacetum coccineum TaxID=301880 RepID=A0ABQ5GPT2_9ASTR
MGVIQKGDFVFEIEEETKEAMEKPLLKLKDDETLNLGKNNEAKMTIYNTLPHKEYKHVFMCKIAKKIWHKLVISHQELPLDELIGNLRVYETVLRNKGIISKSTKEKVKSLALKAKVTRVQTSKDSVCQEGNNEDEDEELKF